MKLAYILLMMLWTSFARANEPAPAACEPLGGITPICGFTAPEDIDALPDGSALIVGSLGRWGSKLGGGIQVYYPGDGTIDTLYQSGDQRIAPETVKDPWGDRTCTAPPVTRIGTITALFDGWRGPPGMGSSTVESNNRAVGGH